MELTNVRTIREIQSKFGFDFKKSFGQNFLTSVKVLQDICDAASGVDNVLEIGPGFGVLTKELSKNFKRVVAIELDNRLPEVLAYTLGDVDNVKIINGDCLKLDIADIAEKEFDGEKFAIAANLPYYITTPIITKLLESRLNVDNIVIMVQKEVAMRLTAEPRTKEYGAISVFCNYYAEPEMITTVPAGCFVPAPKVDSAVISLKPRIDEKLNVIDEKMFFKVVRFSFAQRRKTLLNCLSSGFGKDKATVSGWLEACGIETTRRGETLSKYEFAEISNKIISCGEV